MNRTCYILVTQGADGALDLAPVTEMRDVPQQAAAIRAGGGFQRRMFAETRHQAGRIGGGAAIGEKKGGGR
jgi:hypothetical protein